jgi:hypothetical protein
MLPPNEGGGVIYLDKNSNPDIIANRLFIEIKNPRRKTWENGQQP